jgi:nitrite reductase/ring-hydroxylating ferredoxin subunit
MLMDYKDEPEAKASGCHGCALVARRDFLRDAGVAVAGMLVALGALPSQASAAPMTFVSPVGGTREEKSYPIPAADGTSIDNANEVVLTRWQNKVYAFGLACPHQNTALRWSEKDHQFECSKHHSRFEPDGAYIKDSGRATRAMDRLPIRRDGNNVVVSLDKLYQEDEDEAAWKAAVVNLSA